MAGFPCPKCANDRTDVKDSRSWNGFVRRRRRCYRCEHPFSTVELPVEAAEGFVATHVLDRLAKATSHLNLFIGEFNSLRRSIKAGEAEKAKRGM